jgi:hypothetical protein
MNGLALMNARIGRWLPWAAFCLLALLLFFSTTAPARADSAAPPAVCPSMTADQAPSSPVVAGFWDFRNYLNHPGLASRRVMLQIGVVGMCIALYIIIWRR